MPRAGRSLSPASSRCSRSPPPRPSRRIGTPSRTSTPSRSPPRNPDGTLRYTTVWLVVVGGRGYIRTGDTTWGANVVRDPDVKLVIGEQEYALRADFVEADDERALVMAAFNEKYGWTDTVIGWFRGARPKIMRLASL